MRKDVLASVAVAALLAAAPVWAQSSGATAPAAPAQTESHDSTKSDAAKTDAAKPAAGSAAGSSTTSDTKGSADLKTTTTGAKPAVITAQEPNQLTADHLIGLDVRNPQDEKIGKIEDLLLDADMRVVGVVVSAGGFLGMGDHNVALNRDQVQIQTRGERNERVATVNMTKDQLKAAPEFKTLERQRAEADAERARQQQGATAGAGSRPSTMPPSTTPPAKTQ